MGSKKTFFGPKKKKKLALFAQRKDFLRFRVGFCSKKTGNRRKKTSSPLLRSKIVGLALLASGKLQCRISRRAGERGGGTVRVNGSHGW